jgi:hypothetical protein
MLPHARQRPMCHTRSLTSLIKLNTSNHNKLIVITNSFATFYPVVPRQSRTQPVVRPFGAVRDECPACCLPAQSFRLGTPALQVCVWASSGGMRAVFSHTGLECSPTCIIRPSPVSLPVRMLSGNTTAVVTCRYSCIPLISAGCALPPINVCFTSE